MRIYLDHNATTPLRPEVAEAMARVLRDVYGNPSSTHAEGAAARAALERAREQVAELVGARPDQVVFTSGATEANNTLLAALPRVVTTTAEHPSVLEPARALGARLVGVDREGKVDPEALAEAVDGETQLVSILWANNETGVVQPLEAIARALPRSVALHVDATQALGKIPVEGPWDFLSASAHKLNGPKGTGCLMCRREIRPLLLGGSQERGRRGGTENVAGIVGFGVACELARKELGERAARFAALRDRLFAQLEDLGRRNGSDVLPNTLNVEFPGIEGDALLQALDLEGVAVSAGAACHAGSISASHVLLAMGRTPEQALASLRFSVGHGNDEAQIDAAAALVRELVGRAR